MLKRICQITLSLILALQVMNITVINAMDDTNQRVPTFTHPVSTTSEFTEETNDIVNEHLNDFNVYNFWSKMNSYGGYENYLKNELGGVFAKWAGQDNIADVKTASELQEIGEYVLGLMTIYGFDYCNNKPSSYGKWRAFNGVTSDAFYPAGTTNGDTGHATYNENDIDRICSGQLRSDSIHDGLNMTVDCDLGIDRILKKAGIFKMPCYEVTRMINNGAKRIYRVQDLQVGDIIECYSHSIDKYGSPSGTFGWDGWIHVAMVGDINRDKGTITLFDTGHQFTNTGNPYWTRSLNQSLMPYYADWVGIRYYDIIQDTDTGWVELPDEHWIYNKSHSTRAINEWEKIDDEWYRFDENGYRESGWVFEKDVLYYLKEDGIMATGQVNIDGVDYYFNSDGSIAPWH